MKVFKEPFIDVYLERLTHLAKQQLMAKLPSIDYRVKMTENADQVIIDLLQMGKADHVR